VLAQLGRRGPVEFKHQRSGSVTHGLLEATAQLGAAIIVLGESREPSLERLVTGYVTDELLHCSPVPVAVAPRGWPPAARVPRVSVAYSGDPRAAGTVHRAAAKAQALGLPLRIATMVVRDLQMYPSPVGYDAENLVANQWREQATAAQRDVCTTLPAGQRIECAIGDGATWADALASLGWLPGEVLVLGSSHLSLVERVFLGSNAKRIMRASTVPVIVVPRSAEPALDREQPQET
jgi:nucleotide-binding universal stress UspA family protein